MSDKLFLVLKLIALVSKIIIINLEVSIVYFLTIKILTAKALLCQLLPIDNCGLFWELSDVT
jgi:hypothetical protein